MIIKFRSDNTVNAFRKISDYVKGTEDWYVIDIKKSKRKRSLPQLRYYWGVIVSLICEDTGYFKNEVHQILGGMFLSYNRDGRMFIRSTGDMNTLEIEQYFEKCRIWAMNDLNIRIPLPNEMTEEMLIDIENRNEKMD